VSLSKARLVSSVSAVESPRPWAFFAIGGTIWGAPRWVYLDSLSGGLVSDLDEIAEQLHVNLSGQANSSFDDTAAELVGRFLDRLKATDRLLLPRKK
jgi:hypothetical protein